VYFKKRVLLLLFFLIQLNASEVESLDTISVVDESEEKKKILERSPMPVTVITMDNYKGRNISLNEVLKKVAGIHLKQTGGLGSRTTISVHGLEGKRIKIFIDGVPLNSPDGTFGINDIPVQLIERIEVYKGVVPAKFGGDTLGGAINIVIKEYKTDYVDFTYSPSSFNTHRTTWVLKKVFDKQKIKVGVGGYFNHSDNDYTMESPYAKGLKIKRDHDAYTSNAIATSIEFEDRYFDKIIFEFIHYESEKEIQGIKQNVKEAKVKSSINLLNLKLEKEDIFLENLDFLYYFTYPSLTSNFIDKADICYNFDNTPRPCQSVKGELGGIPHDSKDKQTDIRHDLNLHYKFNENHAFNFHYNYQEADFKPNDPLANKELGFDIGAFPSKTKNSVASLGYELFAFDQKLVNDIGIKYYNFENSVTANSRGIVGIPPKTLNNGHDIGYYESIRYSPIKNLYLKASYEHAFRFPDSSEIFGDGVTITSSPKLKPEESDNFNIGFLYDSYDFWKLPWLKIEANYFSRDLKNMIKLMINPFTSGYANLGEISVRGFETEINVDLNEHWYLYANYTSQELKDEQKLATGTINVKNPTFGLDLPNIPKQYANIGAEYKMYDLFKSNIFFKLFWEGNWVDEYFYNWELSLNQSRKIESQFLHNCGFEYSLDDESLVASFEVHNLFDKTAVDEYNFPLPGRTLHLNFRYTWFE